MVTVMIINGILLMSILVALNVLVWLDAGRKLARALADRRSRRAYVQARES